MTTSKLSVIRGPVTFFVSIALTAFCGCGKENRVFETQAKALSRYGITDSLNSKAGNKKVPAGSIVLPRPIPEEYKIPYDTGLVDDAFLPDAAEGDKAANVPQDDSAGSIAKDTALISEPAAKEVSEVSSLNVESTEARTEPETNPELKKMTLEVFGGKATPVNEKDSGANPPSKEKPSISSDKPVILISLKPAKWNVKSWANKAIIESGEGDTLLVKCGEGKSGKVALSTVPDATLVGSRRQAIKLTAHNGKKSGVCEIALFVTVGKAGTYFESRLKALGGQTKEISFNMSEKSWKSEASLWQHTVEIPRAQKIKEMGILIYYPGDKAEVVIEKLCAE